MKYNGSMHFDTENNHLVSIVVPVYNVEKYLAKCVQSLLGQTYPHIEIVLVDDGSTDGSGALCDSFAQTDSRVVCHHKSNQGLSEARNTGITLSHGAYVTFVDSDDAVAPTMIEELLYYSLMFDADCTGCTFRPFAHEDEMGDYLQPASEIPLLVSGEEALRLLYVGFIPYFMRTAWGFLYKKDALHLDWPPFPVGKYHEDEFSIHRLLYPCEKVAIIPEPLYFYRQREGSITDTCFKMIQVDKIEAGFDQVDYFHKAGNIALEQLAATVALERCIRFWERARRSEELRLIAVPLIEEIYDGCYETIKKRGLDLGCFSDAFELFTIDRNATICALRAAATSFSLRFEDGCFVTLAPATVKDVRIEPFVTLFRLFLADPTSATEITDKFMVDAEPGFMLGILIDLINEPNLHPAMPLPEESKPRRSLVSRAIRKLRR